MGNRIVESDRLVDIGIAQDIKDRRERFLEDLPPLRIDCDNGGPDIEAAGNRIDHLDAVADRLAHGIECRLVDEWTDESVRVTRIADLDAREQAPEPSHQFICDAFMDD